MIQPEHPPWLRGAREQSMDLNALERAELQRKLKQLFIRQLVRPEEDLVRFFAAKVYAGQLSGETLEWLTQITQQAIQEIFVKKQLASQLADTKPRHLLIIETDQEKREFGLFNPVYSIGRNPTCDICIASPFVSSHHATLVRLPDAKDDYYYRMVDGDLKGTTSANGFIVNGRKVQATDLHNGDNIILGPQINGTYYALKGNSRDTAPSDSEISNSDEDGEIRQNLPQNLARAFSISAG